MMLVVDQDDFVAGVCVTKADATGTWPIGDPPDGTLLGKIDI
jgi:hypothetical protein